MSETGNVVRQIHEQGPGFFTNLWNNHSDDVIRLVKIVILALVVIVAAKLVSLAARKIIARLFKKIEGDESLTYATYTIGPAGAEVCKIATGTITEENKCILQ